MSRKRTAIRGAFPMIYRALFLTLANLVVLALIPVAATLALASQAMGG